MELDFGTHKRESISRIAALESQLNQAQMSLENAQSLAGLTKDAANQAVLAQRRCAALAAASGSRPGGFPSTPHVKRQRPGDRVSPPRKPAPPLRSVAEIAAERDALSRELAALRSERQRLGPGGDAEAAQLRQEKEGLREVLLQSERNLARERCAVPGSSGGRRGSCFFVFSPRGSFPRPG